jgi:hypothetical protein
MIQGRQGIGMVLVAACALSIAACSSSTKLSTKALCENAGGRYAQGVCQPGTAKKAEEMCLGFGGIYMTDEDLCHVKDR